MNKQIVLNSKGVLVQYVESEAVIVSMDKSLILSVNPVGADVLKCLQKKGSTSVDELAEELETQYSGNLQNLKEDLNAFVGSLKEHGVVYEQ